MDILTFRREFFSEENVFRLPINEVYDLLVEQFARGDEFFFDPQMVIKHDPASDLVFLDGREMRTPKPREKGEDFWVWLQRDRKEKREIREEWWSVLDRPTTKDFLQEKPDWLAGRNGIYLGIWPKASGKPRMVHYDVVDARKRRGWWRRQMSMRRFLLWARPYDPEEELGWHEKYLLTHQTTWSGSLTST
jgi:hypothetical protein